jgi:hypothetical protein
MEVSEQKIASDQSAGLDLLSKVVTLTGLPEKQVQSELCGIMDQVGISPKDLTLEQLREAMVAYLDFVHSGILKHPDAS